MDTGRSIREQVMISKNDKKCRMCTIISLISLGVSTGLFIGGFLVPPTGVIDGSVLKAVGELIAFPTLAFGYRAIEIGYDLKFQHGQTNVTISSEIDEKPE